MRRHYEFAANPVLSDQVRSEGYCCRGLRTGLAGDWA